jgi:hypothetical protein
MTGVGGGLETAPPWRKQTCTLPKIFRTAGLPRCQSKQVKAIRAAACFPYQGVSPHALPESFFLALPSLNSRCRKVSRKG